jgi:hypothetical protein
MDFFTIFVTHLTGNFNSILRLVYFIFSNIQELISFDLVFINLIVMSILFHGEQPKK